MRFSAAIRGNPGHPVRPASFGMNLIRGHVGSILHCAWARPLHRIDGSELCFRPRLTAGAGERCVTLTCPNCGNDRNFLVKTLQMHVVNVEGSRVEVTEESRPAVLEVLCDECESALNFAEFEDTLRKEVLLTIGAR